MINELYELSEAMKTAEINVQSWHRKYKLLPNISKKAPCICIMLDSGHVKSFHEITEEHGSHLRRFGDNQGFYPGMNLAPLYRISDDSVKKEISKTIPDQIDEPQIERLKSLCSFDNWNPKFREKYKISMEKRPKDMLDLLTEHGYEPLKTLISETNFFSDPTRLHNELEACAFRMISAKENVQLALQVLFYMEKDKDDPEKNYGSLSVIFDSPRLLKQGISAASVRFTSELNDALLLADTAGSEESDTVIDLDAFSTPFEQRDEPMPEVKLAGGFDVKLRTMFREQRCQQRYGRIEDASYPLSLENRKRLQAALSWMGGDPKQKDITWTNIGKNEIMFVYPLSQLAVPTSFTRMFNRLVTEEISFKARSQKFLAEIKRGRDRSTDSHAQNIHIFILKKIDKGRTKVLFTRQTDPCELEKYAEEWTTGCENLPKLSIEQPDVPFPLESADLLNCFWKQDGTLSTDKFKPVPKYHGMELLLEPRAPIQADLHALVYSVGNLAALQRWEERIKGLKKVKGQIALAALLLYRANIRKEYYMENYPYLYGQLLKVSDELHLLYCNAVRNGDIPTQLVGGALFQAATEAPIRTLSTLGQRMTPYVLWAKSYKYKNVQKEKQESWRAAWYLSIYERVATQLSQVWSNATRLTDEEKAQLFIGYLAELPKKKDDVAGAETKNKEENHE